MERRKDEASVWKDGVVPARQLRRGNAPVRFEAMNLEESQFAVPAAAFS